MIEAYGLTKLFGRRVAVDDLTFTVRPGVVTGFLGPNGAGKSTTMRMAVGLDHPTMGGVTINGVVYEDLPAPICEVGVLLEARAIHTGRTGYQHLLVAARSHGIPRRRVDEVIGLVGLDRVAGQRAGTYSLGMAQRLGLAAALLGDPGVLILDEPVNGLDPAGIRWIRDLLRALAAEGRTVFVSSHLLSEMALTAGHLVVIGRGRLIADTSVDEFVRAAAGEEVVRVRSPRAHELADLLRGQGGRVTVTGTDTFDVSGLTCAQVGDAACAAGLAVHGLGGQATSLEDAFVGLTRGAVEFAPDRPVASPGGPAGPAPPAPAPARTGQPAVPPAAPDDSAWRPPDGAGWARMPASADDVLDSHGEGQR
ncbi:ABC transporter ATP-binding protein [Frankia nepalensis]|uniref:ATP-binding cassette domain-containing protein n=1 Tax=Frankia nepalensis TaxID=1836974 RepID=A0A937UPE4_9ACTN|nr:ATP-binding cassette domain-containing protein [Frankia nepalensis]MBL7500254.1 ATP-binding cassette domain-containing protein [Frankia nepalensis]MBL7513530.1 ATP-binding cassette domain-containing protein [Frankia nepalensis]MBL7628993.1 ATP-binding cassette domain-containing protein [Frankia nepalensis]